MPGYDEVIGIYSQGDHALQVLRFCTLNDLPVMFVKTPDGGMDALIYDWRTGEFTRNGTYLFKAVAPGADVEDLTQEHFEAYVAALRKQMPPVS